MNRQISRLGVAMLVLFSALFVQLNLVQVIRADELRDHPANRRSILQDFGRPRGVVQTADGVVLARSVPSEGQFDTRREYPEGAAYASLTGFFSFAFGSEGVERTYNDELVGRSLPVRVSGLDDLLLDEERTGNVTLTIPSGVQRAAVDALGDRPGAVVALDPRDGAVLALHSAPTFDPNLLVVPDQAEAAANRQTLRPESGDSPLVARSYARRYFPGSTFKVVTAAAGLLTGTVTTEEPAYPVESEWVPPLTTRPLRNFGGSSCGGTLPEILRVSCNTAFARMGVDIGADDMAAIAGDFGFDAAIPIDLPRPVASRFPEATFFADNTPLLAQAAIGQNEVQATPLQMALVAATVANRGIAMRPHVMAEIRDQQGEVVERFAPERWREPITPEVAATLTEAMVGVVEGGTARNLALPGLRVAGKTGTAQLGTEPPRSHAWIIGFAPADAPRVAVAAIVEGQEGADEQTGGRVAAPLARAVLQAALAATAQPGATSGTQSAR
jgi:peptidoglycan glycosyltransferase